MLQTLLNTPKIIKHIQRGVFSSVTGVTPVITVQLAGFTNVDKMVVIPQIMDNLTAWRPQSFTVTTQSFTIQGSGSQRGWGIYEVIEFA